MDTSKKTKAVRIVIFTLVVIGIVLLMRMVAGGAKESAKYDTLSQCLVEKGISFYGAFWCPHCQAQERSLQASRQKLESMGLYKECSTPDGSGQLATCVDKKIQSYPTWVYQNGFAYESAADPIVCAIQPGPAEQPAQCASYGSTLFKTWIFPDVKVQSATEPAHSGSTWTFGPDTRTNGEIPPETLSKLSSCALPAGE